FIVAIFFLASSGASAAYLTVSEVFPMETRALAIAFFYAVGTAAGGIAGPLLFGQLIGPEPRGKVGIALMLGAAVMALGGVAELLLGIRSERASLEDIAKPLTAQEAVDNGDEQAGLGRGAQEQVGSAHTTQEPSDQQREARECRRDAERERARAADHRARSLEAGVGVSRTTEHERDAEAASASSPGEATGDTGCDPERQREDDALAELAALRASALDEQALAHELLAEASAEHDEHAREALRARAQAAEQRARGYTERARAADADDDAAGERHNSLAAAADERAREREQWAMAEDARAVADSARGDGDGHDGHPDDRDPDERDPDDRDPDVERARADMHEHWAARHEAAAQQHDARAARDEPTEERARRRVAEQEGLALAAEQRLAGAEHTANADAVRRELESSDAARQEQHERERLARQREERIRERVQRRERSQHSGLRRFAPGPGTITAGRRSGLDEQRQADVEQVLDQEIEVVSRALGEHGPIDRAELAQLV